MPKETHTSGSNALKGGFKRWLHTTKAPHIVSLRNQAIKSWTIAPYDFYHNKKLIPSEKLYTLKSLGWTAHAIQAINWITSLSFFNFFVHLPCFNQQNKHLQLFFKYDHGLLRSLTFARQLWVPFVFLFDRITCFMIYTACWSCWLDSRP